MVKLRPDTAVTEGQEAVDGLPRIRIGDALDELMDRTNGVRPNVLSGVIKHEAEDHVV